MKDANFDLGSKPLWLLNFWFFYASLLPFVHESLSKIKVDDRTTFAFKEKLKRLKGNLTRWNVKVFGDVRILGTWTKRKR